MINLSPPEVRETIKYGRLNVRVLRYFIGIGTLAVMIAGMIFFGIRITDTKKVELEAELADSSKVFDEYGDVLSEAKDLSDTIDTIKVLLDREVKFSEVLNDIAAIIPQGATLDGIALTSEQDTLQLTSTLSSQSLGPVFQQNLIESGLFEVVDIIALTSEDGGRATGVYSVVFKSDKTISEAEAAAAAAEAEQENQ